MIEHLFGVGGGEAEARATLEQRRCREASHHNADAALQHQAAQRATVNTHTVVLVSVVKASTSEPNRTELK